MKRILSALLIGVMTVVGGIAGKAGLKRVAPALVKETVETGAKQAAKQTAKKAGKAAKSTKAQKGAAATATSGAAAGAATQIHDTDKNGEIVPEAEAHEPTENGTTSEPADSNERYRKRDLADTSGL